MKLQFVLYVAFVLLFGDVFSKIPDYIHVCKKDGNLSQCLKDNFHNVIKELAENGGGPIKVPDIKNIKIAKMQLNAGGLKIALTDAVFHGIENIRTDSFNMDGNVLKFKTFIPHLQYSGDYQMNGRILILPIQGEGKFNMSHYDCAFELVIKLSTEERNGKKYFSVAGNWDDVQINVKVKRSTYDFENLFGGDPRLGPAMNKFLNENDAEVFQQIEPAVKEGTAFYILLPYINAFLRKIPIDDLFEI